MIVLLAISKNEVRPIFMPQKDLLIRCLTFHMCYCSFTQFIEAIFIQVRMLILNRYHTLKFVVCQFVKRNFPYFDEVYVLRISDINILCQPLSISVLLTDCFHYDWNSSIRTFGTFIKIACRWAKMASKIECQLVMELYDCLILFRFSIF